MRKSATYCFRKGDKGARPMLITLLETLNFENYSSFKEFEILPDKLVLKADPTHSDFFKLRDMTAIIEHITLIAPATFDISYYGDKIEITPIR